MAETIKHISMGDRVNNKLSLVKPVKISSELYNIEKYRWKMSTLGYRMLFAISQCVDGNMLFKEVAFPKEALFKYLGIQNTNKKYKQLRDTLLEVKTSGIDCCTINSRGKRVWTGMSWITWYKFSEDGDRVYIDINDRAMDFLCALKQYALIQPKTYLKLNTDYQNWLYPLLKMRVKLGIWEMSIEYIYESLNLEQTKSYSKSNRNYIANILKNIIGIQASDAFKQEQRAASKEKRAPKPVAWDYVRGAKGNLTGTLYTIHNETDINVYACVKKDGRSYDKVIFYISEKPDKMSRSKKEQLHQDIVQSADNDMGGIKDRKNRCGLLFENENPAFIKEQIQAVPVFYDDEDLAGMINPEAGLSTIADVASRAGYRKHPNGKWYKI